MNTPVVLLADIGGTNARFALCNPALPAPLLLDSVRQQAVKAFPTLVDAARHYLDTIDLPGHRAVSGVFAVAGRVDGDLARITNHPWVISRAGTRDALGFRLLDLINDFSAQALACELLCPEDLVAIGGVERATGSARDLSYAVLGPGTGLGVSALLVRDGVSFALETEGGHIGFAPSTSEEARLLELLTQRFGRVSNERLLSGGGLSNLHWALSRLSAAVATGPGLAPEQVTAGASSGDPVCQRAIEVFCEVFGSIAGDLVLTLGAWDGVFLCGGLVPRLLPQLQRSAFRQRFEAKGRFGATMSRVPTLAVMHPQAGLLGAAAFALRHQADVQLQSAGTTRNGILA